MTPHDRLKDAINDLKSSLNIIDDMENLVEAKLYDGMNNAINVLFCRIDSIKRMAKIAHNFEKQVRDMERNPRIKDLEC